MTSMPAATPIRYRFSADEYEALIQCGVLRPDARLELIEGEIIEQPAPQGYGHLVTAGRGQAFQSPALAGATVASDAILL